MPASARPWTSLPGVRLLGVPFADIGRSGAIIDCVAVEIFQNAGHTWPFTMSEGEMREMLGKEVCDISQSIQRGPIKKLGTITTATNLYFYGHDLVLPGKYFYLLSGYPRGLTWDVMGGPTVSHKTLGRKQMKDGRPRDTNHFQSARWRTTPYFFVVMHHGGRGVAVVVVMECIVVVCVFKGSPNVFSNIIFMLLVIVIIHIYKWSV